MPLFFSSHGSDDHASAAANLFSLIASVGRLRRPILRESTGALMAWM